MQICSLFPCFSVWRLNQSACSCRKSFLTKTKVCFLSPHFWKKSCWMKSGPRWDVWASSAHWGESLCREIRGSKSSWRCLFQEGRVRSSRLEFRLLRPSFLRFKLEKLQPVFWPRFQGGVYFVSSHTCCVSRGLVLSGGTKWQSAFNSFLLSRAAFWLAPSANAVLLASSERVQLEALLCRDVWALWGSIVFPFCCDFPDSINNSSVTHWN